MTPDEQPGRDVPPKATLFCPECDHRSRFDGDWTVVRTARAVHYACPDCRTGITTRPTGRARSGSRSPAAAFWTAWRVGFRAWRRVWFPTVPAGTDGQ
jgi:uncharacterized protein YlaI